MLVHARDQSKVHSCWKESFLEARNCSARTRRVPEHQPQICRYEHSFLHGHLSLVHTSATRCNKVIACVWSYAFVSNMCNMYIIYIYTFNYTHIYIICLCVYSRTSHLFCFFQWQIWQIQDFSDSAGALWGQYDEEFTTTANVVTAVWLSGEGLCHFELCLTSPSLVVSSPDATVWHIVLAETLVLVACAGFVWTSVGATVKQKVQEETTRSIDNRTMQYSMYSLVWHLVIYLWISFVYSVCMSTVYRVFLSYSIPCHPCDARYQSLRSQTHILVGTCTILCQSIQSASQAGSQSVGLSFFVCLVVYMIYLLQIVRCSLEYSI